MEVKLTVRLPERVHAELVKRAAEEHRSLNQQVIHDLERIDASADTRA